MDEFACPIARKFLKKGNRNVDVAHHRSRVELVLIAQVDVGWPEGNHFGVGSGPLRVIIKLRAANQICRNPIRLGPLDVAYGYCEIRVTKRDEFGTDDFPA